MPKPQANETKSDYVSRFMGSPEALSDYPDEKQRLAVAYSLYEHRNEMRNAGDLWPLKCSCRFIEAGLVGYKEYGMVLVTKEALDKMAQSFVGKPVINEVHKEVDPSVYADGTADGIVTSVRYEQDGWFWADFLVWDPSTQRNIKSNAYSVSCAYTVSAIGEGGERNNVPYDQEVLDGSYTHLAVVSNPRYEGARIIVYNSKEGGHMFKLFNRKAKEKIELKDLANATTEVDGKQVLVSELAKLHAPKPVENAGDKLSEDTVVEFDNGEEATLKDLKNAYREKMKNDADEKEKKDKEEADRKNAEDADAKKKKEDEDRKNAEDAEKKRKEDEEKELKNAKGSKHFDDLQKAANLRGEPQQPQISTRFDRAKVGAERYGSPKK